MNSIDSRPAFWFYHLAAPGREIQIGLAAGLRRCPNNTAKNSVPSFTARDHDLRGYDHPGDSATLCSQGYRFSVRVFLPDRRLHIAVRGYVPGALACLIVTAGLPFAQSGFSHLTAVDISRTALFVGVSLLVSRTASTERRAREVLALSNDELDRRARERTVQLGTVVEQLQEEIEERRRTETALRESEDRVEFALEAAGIGHISVDLTTGQATRSLRHDRIFGYDETLTDGTITSWLSTSSLRTGRVSPKKSQPLSAAETFAGLSAESKRAMNPCDGFPSVAKSGGRVGKSGRHGGHRHRHH